MVKISLAKVEGVNASINEGKCYRLNSRLLWSKFNAFSKYVKSSENPQQSASLNGKFQGFR